MDWLKKANAINIQEERAQHSEWAFDYLDAGMLERAKINQLEARELHERFVAIMGWDYDL